MAYHWLLWIRWPQRCSFPLILQIGLALSPDWMCLGKRGCAPSAAHVPASPTSATVHDPGRSRARSDGGPADTARASTDEHCPATRPTDSVPQKRLVIIVAYSITDRVIGHGERAATWLPYALVALLREPESQRLRACTVPHV